MDNRLREIIDTASCCRQTIREASQYLPENAEALNAWIEDAVRSVDVLAFCTLTVGALHRGLPVRSHHLEQGLKFLPGYHCAGCMVLNVTGDDVPARVARALQLGGFGSMSQAAILIATWQWCADRSLPFPQDLLNSARGSAHRYRKIRGGKGMFLLFGTMAGDRPLIDIVTGSISDDARTALDAELEDVTQELLSVFRGDILDTIGDIPAAAPKPKTLRRAVGHIGRNDPCPCGSGKKHKHCCFGKTRERLLNSSDVAGLTMQELDSNLEAHMTPARLASLGPGKLVLLDPLKLDPALLPALVARLADCKLSSETTAVMEKTGYTDDMEQSWLNLVMLTTQARRKNVLARLVALNPIEEGDEEKDPLPVCARLLLAEGDSEKTLAILEETARMLVDRSEKGWLFMHGMSLALSHLGALGIMLTQSVIARMEIGDALSITDLLATRRAELDLPIEDPMAAVIGKRIAAEARKEENKDSAKLAAAMRKMDALAEKERKAAAAAREMEKQLAKLTKKAAASKEPAADTPAPDDSEIKALREKLRIHEANERINAEERAAHRRATGELLLLEESLREKERGLQKAAPSHTRDDDDETHILPGALEGTQPLRLIAYPAKFLASLRPFPRHIGRQAIALLGRIASGEPAAFHDVLRLKACHEIFRARIGTGHRLLFRLHPEELEVIALIDRRDLDARIKTLRKHE